jgi:ATP-dependent 26S proteasome regulatory subunit
MDGFKQCQNGHYYKEDLKLCPYCSLDKKLEELGNDVPFSRPPQDTAMCYCRIPTPEEEKAWKKTQEQIEKKRKEIEQKKKEEQRKKDEENSNFLKQMNALNLSPYLVCDVNEKIRKCAIKKVETTIGWAVYNDFVLPIKSGFSNNHAKIIFNGHIFEIIALDPNKPVCVNEQIIQKTTLKDGDILYLGDITIIFHLEKMNDVERKQTEIKKENNLFGKIKKFFGI